MAKILYPVGTQVQVVANFGDSSGDRDIGKVGTVVSYTKKNNNPHVYNGTTMPYRIQFEDGNYVFAAVKELKRYNPTQVNKVEKSCDAKQPESKPAQDVYTKVEVDEMLNSLYAEMVSLVESTYSTAMEALDNTKIIAKMTDRNFSAVARTIKTLSHDDD